MLFKLHYILSLAAVSLTITAYAQTRIATDEIGVWDRCPDSIDSGLLNMWRNQLINEVAKNRNYKAVLERINICFPDEKPACYADLITWTDAQLNPNDYTMTEEVPTLNSIEQLPKEFRNSFGEVIIPENLAELVKSNPNMMSLAYKTRSSGALEQGGNRNAVGISTPQMDIVLQLQLDHNVPDDHKGVVPKPQNGDLTKGLETLTIITRDKTKTPNVGQMRRLTKTPNGGYKFTNELENQLCSECHTAPFRPLSPQGYKVSYQDQEKMTPEQEAQVDSFNRRFLLPRTVWGTAERNGKSKRVGAPMDSQPLGWAPVGSRTRTPAFLQQCATNEKSYSYTTTGEGPYKTFEYTQKTPPNIRWPKLAAAMNCIECHADSERGKLHERFRESELKFKILGDKLMPPMHRDLNEDERIALLSCLKAEREAVATTWRQSGEWMKGASCFTPQFKTKVNYKPASVNTPANTNTKTNQQ